MGIESIRPNRCDAYHSQTQTTTEILGLDTKKGSIAWETSCRSRTGTHGSDVVTVVVFVAVVAVFAVVAVVKVVAVVAFVVFVVLFALVAFIAAALVEIAGGWSVEAGTLAEIPGRVARSAFRIHLYALEPSI